MLLLATLALQRPGLTVWKTPPSVNGMLNVLGEACAKRKTQQGAP